MLHPVGLPGLNNLPLRVSCRRYPLLALSGHRPVHCTCPLLKVKRTRLLRFRPISYFFTCRRTDWPYATGSGSRTGAKNFKCKRFGKADRALNHQHRLTSIQRGPHGPGTSRQTTQPSVKSGRKGAGYDAEQNYLDAGGLSPADVSHAPNVCFRGKSGHRDCVAKLTTQSGHGICRAGCRDGSNIACAQLSQFCSASYHCACYPSQKNDDLAHATVASG